MRKHRQGYGKLLYVSVPLSICMICALSYLGGMCYNHNVMQVSVVRVTNMDFVSILDLKKVPEREGGRPAFFLDLNLNQIIERICHLWERNVSNYYYYLPADKACEDYRREVLADVQRGGIYEILCRFMKVMQERKEVCAKGAAVRGNLPKASMFIAEAGLYCEAFGELHRQLKEQELKSRGMRSFQTYLGRYLESVEFLRLQETVMDLRETLDNFRLQINYENERIYVELQAGSLKKGSRKLPETQEEGKVTTYDNFLKNAFPGKERTMRSPFDINIDVSELEQEILKILQKERPDFFKEMKKFYGEFENYADETLLRFVEEIEFYLSFCCFERQMQEQGYEFCAPESGANVQMKAYGLYDLALACTIRGKSTADGDNVSGRQVIPNDMSYLEGERFFVLTGPNQGGKTTFARSLGQLVYFTKMGLDVPAKKATVPCFDDILTHFSVEESVETGRGKLKEELVRLQPMMDASCKNAFVIINELFTTAANYDACIMGKRVLQHFLEQESWGIYVTHLKELADPEPGIVSLRAMLDENGKQSFEIRRSAAVESANAINQVNKYRLTYEQLKERLA